MITSELVLKLAEMNPHLYQRDVEILVNAILDEITGALRRGDRIGHDASFCCPAVYQQRASSQKAA